LYEAKGQDLALEVLAREGLEAMHLLIAGDGERRADYEDMARRLGVHERAHFLGWRRDVPALLAACDFLLLPSRWEGLPTIVLESLAVGRPVVAARVDGIDGVVRDSETGFTAAVGDVEGLAEACSRMLSLDEEERRAMGARGRRTVSEEFTVEGMVRGLIDVYEELV
jgi:glycosyltransferase involved in cell wall biosynthesis